MSGKIDISVVCPVRDEEENVPELVRRLRETLDEMALSFELVFVTDVNTDRTVPVLHEQHHADPRVKMVKLSKSWGQHVAVMAGLDACAGDHVVLMDGDLQDEPEDIPKLWKRQQEGGFDIVYGVKDTKNESALRNLFSQSFVRLLNWMSDAPVEHNTSMFRIMSRRVVDELRRFGEMDPILTGLVSLVGLPAASTPVSSGRRFAGDTKYDFRRQINFAISYLSAFSTRPLRLIAVAGVLLSALAGVALVALVVALLFGYGGLGWAIAVAAHGAFAGIQLVALGIMGEYVGRIFLETKRRPRYVVEERLGFDGSKARVIRAESRAAHE